MSMESPNFRRALRPALFADHELKHMSEHWLWIFLLGLLLVAAGIAAIAVPAATIGTTFSVTIFLGILFMVSGIANIVSSFWIGQWSGFLVQLLVGLIYVACGFIMTERPLVTAITLTFFVAVAFVVLGIFRTVAALTLRFPQWGWALLNGVITLVAGIIIYRQLPFDAFWVIGVLVGVEVLFNGWSWMMIGLMLKRISTVLPKDDAPSTTSAT